MTEARSRLFVLYIWRPGLFLLLIFAIEVMWGGRGDYWKLKFVCLGQNLSTMLMYLNFGAGCAPALDGRATVANCRSSHRRISWSKWRPYKVSSQPRKCKREGSSTTPWYSWRICWQGVGGGRAAAL
jgi:hypothetical protein